MSKVTAAATIVLAASFISVGWLRPSATTGHSAHVDSASVPMDIRNNRVFVPLRITGTQGKGRNAVFWVDTGGDTLVISGLLAYELGLKQVGKSHGSDDATDLNCLGLIVQVKGNKTVLVSGVSKRDGRPEVPGVKAGDILLQVDDHKMTGASLAEVLEYLSGSPGEVKYMKVRRGNKELTLLATVLPHPPGEKTLREASDF